MRKVRAAGKDYYKVLGVPRDCDASALKKAYRKVREPAPHTLARPLTELCTVSASSTDSPLLSAQLALKLHPDKKCAHRLSCCGSVDRTHWCCVCLLQHGAGRR